MKLNKSIGNSDKIQVFVVGTIWVILFAILLSYGHAKDKKARESAPQTSICNTEKERGIK